MIVFKGGSGGRAGAASRVVPQATQAEAPSLRGSALGAFAPKPCRLESRGPVRWARPRGGSVAGDWSARIARTTSTSSSSSYGFGSSPTRPAPEAPRASARRAMASPRASEHRTTGVSASSGSACMLRITSQPLTSGSWTSSTTTEGRIRRATATASCPWSAVATVKPAASRARRAWSKTRGVSSTTRTVRGEDRAGNMMDAESGAARNVPIESLLAVRRGATASAHGLSPVRAARILRAARTVPLACRQGIGGWLFSDRRPLARQGFIPLFLSCSRRAFPRELPWS